MKITVAEIGNNRIGDLFTERACDIVRLFGYQVIRFNVAKAGREIDILARHRHEDRHALFECKAQQSKVDGAAINKFCGTLQAEQDRYLNLQGYVFSISGYRDSAIEQESALSKQRVILLGPTDVGSELEDAGLVCPRETAAWAVRALVEDPTLEVSPIKEIVASRIGWLWKVDLRRGRSKKYHALVHADGQVISAKDFSSLAESTAKSLREVEYYPIREANDDHVLDLYRSFIRREYGAVSYEGLPADSLSTPSLYLQQVYVPLHLQAWGDQTNSFYSPDREIGEEENAIDPTRRPSLTVGEVLSSHKRIAVLASPGAGKSTLLSRLALAYSQTEDTFLEQEKIALTNLMPLPVRCRDITDAQQTLWDLIEKISDKAAFPESRPEFVAAVREKVRLGRVILLIDGLDEISTALARGNFVRNLNNFLSIYPEVRAVVSSREAGFRPIAGAAAEMFTLYGVSDLSQSSIRKLVSVWHELAPRASTGAVRRPKELANRIIGNSRLLLLATNPLLLTTLLLVERWIGDLPRNRSVLYDKAIEVLLMTWNVEGHKPLRTDEVVPQLAFLAHEMVDRGTQRVNEDELQEILAQARRDMPDVLGFARLSAQELVARIELRSSLLIRAGSELTDGRLQPVFEFKHRTFLEFLAARALVEGWNRGGRARNLIGEQLEPYLLNEDWQEIVVLAATLAGREGAQVVRRLCSALEPGGATLKEAEFLTVGVSLKGCLIDDVQVSPPLAEQALKACVTHTYIGMDEVRALLSSRYGSIVSKTLDRTLQDDEPGYSDPNRGWTAGLATVCEFQESASWTTFGSAVEALLDAESIADRRRGFGAIGSGYFHVAKQTVAQALALPPLRRKQPSTEACAVAFPVLETALHLFPITVSVFVDRREPTELRVQAAWALNWLLDLITPVEDSATQIFEAAREILLLEESLYSPFASWTIWSLGLRPRGILASPLSSTEKAFIDTTLAHGESKFHELRAACVLAYHGRYLSDRKVRRALLSTFGSDENFVKVMTSAINK